MDTAPHDPEQLQRARDLLQEHAACPASTQALLPGLTWWFDPERPALIAYREAWGFRVVAGPPIAPPDQLADATQRFLQDCQRSHKRAVFFGLDDDALAALQTQDLALDALPIGLQPEWNPASYSLAGPERKSLRAQVRRAQRTVTVRALTPEQLAPDAPDRLACERLLAAWSQHRRMAPMGFLVAVRPFDDPQHRLTWLAEDADRTPVAFLTTAHLTPNAGWLLEHLIRHPNAPNGTAELLIHTAITEAAQHRVDTLTLGLAPLSGLKADDGSHPALHALLRACYRHLSPLYGFHNLYRFKLRFRPHHTPTHYLASPQRVSLWALAATLRAFAGPSATAFALDTAARLARRTPRAAALAAATLAFFTLTLLLAALWSLASGTAPPSHLAGP